MTQVLEAPDISEVRAALERLRGDVRRTPLIRFDGDDGEPEIWLKLENLQPIGSFKLRGALNKMRSLGESELADGAVTASAGNMAQGVAYAARLLGVRASVVVPETAPRVKLEAIERLGGAVISVPYDEWWETMRSRGRAGIRGVFVHPFADRQVMAGNGTIGLEILEDLPDVDTVLVPWGGGGLTCGIAATVKAVNPSVRVYASNTTGSVGKVAKSRSSRAPTWRITRSAVVRAPGVADRVSVDLGVRTIEAPSIVSSTSVPSSICTSLANAWGMRIPRLLPHFRTAMRMALHI